MNNSHNTRNLTKPMVSLFGSPAVGHRCHLGARYPFPARLNDHYLASLRASDVGSRCRKGTKLYEEGTAPLGLYVVLEGRIKVSVSSAQGKTLVLGFFGPGTILGLAATILGRAHGSTAEADRPARVWFVAREALAREIQTDAAAACRAAELVSESCYFILEKLAAVQLSDNASQKLARCLLGLLASNGECSELYLGQESVAQLIGVSRETVTREASKLRQKGVLRWNRSDGCVIQDRAAMERVAFGSGAPV